VCRGEFVVFYFDGSVFGVAATIAIAALGATGPSAIAALGAAGSTTGSTTG
jgi:hypothetical protein